MVDSFEIIPEEVIYMNCPLQKNGAWYLLRLGKHKTCDETCGWFDPANKVCSITALRSIASTLKAHVFAGLPDKNMPF